MQYSEILEHRDRFEKVIKAELVRALTLVVPAVVTAPLARVQCIMQVQTDLVLQGKLSKVCEETKTVARYLYEIEGFNSLWRGSSAFVASLMVRSLSSAIVLPGLLETRYHRNNKAGISISEIYGLSLISSMTLSSLCYPFDFVYTRKSADLLNSTTKEYFFRDYKHILHETSRLHFAKFGVLYGYSAVMLHALVLESLNCSSIFIGKRFKSRGSEEAPNRKVRFVVVCNYALSILLGYPLLTVARKKMMTAGQLEYSYSIYSAMHSAIKNEGWKSLYRGVSCCLLRDGIFVATLLLIGQPLRRQ